jgi:hypothetical protein
MSHTSDESPYNLGAGVGRALPEPQGRALGDSPYDLSGSRTRMTIPKQLPSEAEAWAKLKAAAKAMLALEARRMYERDLDGDLSGPAPCPCPGCEGLRQALAALELKGG